MNLSVPQTHWVQLGAWRLLLVGILVFSLAIRVTGVFHGLPYALGHEDEWASGHEALHFLADHTLKPHHWRWPPLFAEILAGIYGLVFVIGRVAGLWHNAADFAFLYITKPGYVHAIARAATALFGVATVFLTYCLGRQAYSRRVGLIAACFVAVSPVHVWRSTWSLPDVPATVFATLCLLGCVRMLCPSSSKSVWLAATCAGLAAACKYNAGAVSVSWMVAYGLRHLGRERWAWILLRCLGGVALMAAAFLLVSPYWLLSPRTYFEGLQEVEQHMKAGQAAWFWPLEQIATDSRGIGWMMIGGLVWACIRRRNTDWVLASSTMVLLLWLSQCNYASPRHWVPVIPALAVLGARFLDEAATALRIPKPTLSMAFLTVCLTASLAFSGVVNAIQWLQIDTRVVAKHWIEANIPAGTPLALGKYEYNPPLVDERILFAYDVARREPIKTRIEHFLSGQRSYRLVDLTALKFGKEGQVLSRRAKSLEEIATAEGAQYLVVSSLDKSLEELFGQQTQELWLRKVRQFSPSPQCVGPTISIYSIERNHERK